MKFEKGVLIDRFEQTYFVYGEDGKTYLFNQDENGEVTGRPFKLEMLLKWMPMSLEGAEDLSEEELEALSKLKINDE